MIILFLSFLCSTAIVTLDVTNDGIAIVRINDTSAKMNTLNAQLSGKKCLCQRNNLLFF